MKSAIQEWADAVRTHTQQAEALIDGLAPGTRLRQANGLNALIQGTPDEELVEGSDMTGARAKELLAMHNGLGVWLLTPLWEGGPTPLQVISRREV